MCGEMAAAASSAAPAPAVVGNGLGSTASGAATAAPACTAGAVDKLGALAPVFDLPPLAGGTPHGAEFATVPRTRWKSRQQFVLVLMGYCIGVGNLWRFPYLCGKYGGGAFIVAYLCTLFIGALPLFFYECVLGQKFQKGPAETFRKMAPKWVGLAYVPAAMTLFFLPYYQFIVTYALHYFLASFQSPLPWVDGTTPDLYLSEVVLRRTSSLSDEGSGQIHGTLLAENLAVWVITALCLIKGIHSAGKAAYITVILPVVMLVCLFFVCVRLEGSELGLRYYLTPRFEYLVQPQVWGVAAGQIIFSLSPGMGCCIALASFHEPSYRGLFADSVVIALSNSAFSLFGGLVVFSVVGHIANSQGKPVEEVAASGEGLAFIVFAQGLASIGEGAASSVCSALFFLTLFLLGLDSTFACVETLQTYLNDWILKTYPGEKISTRGNAIRLACLCSGLFLLGLPYCTRGGYYLLEIADHFVVTYVLTVSVLLEYIMIGWVYTAEQMLCDVLAITGIELPPWVVWQIRVIAPLNVLLAVLLLFIAEVTTHSLAEAPAWAVALLGVLPVCFSLSFFALPLVAFRARRLLQGQALTREGFAAAVRRAKAGGYMDPRLAGDEASLSENRQ